MIRKLSVLFAALFLFCVPVAHAAQITVHSTSYTGFGLYGDSLEQRGPDGFWDIDVSVIIDSLNSRACTLEWG